jgi:hypothetical protein
MRIKIAAACATALVLASGAALAEGSAAPEQRQQGERQQGEGTELSHEGHGAVQEGAGTEQDESAIGESDVEATAGQEELTIENLSREQKMELQRKLQQEGFYDGNIDGIVGPQTLMAIQQYQDREGIEGGGSFNQETAERLGLSTGEMQPVRGEDEGAAGQRAGHGQGAQGSQMGAAAGEHQEGQAGGRAGAAEQEQDAIELSALDSEQAKELQQRLQDLGLYRGEIDGIVGPKTKAALSSYFQQRAQLASRGQIRTEDAQALGIEVDDIQPVRGAEGEDAEGTQRLEGTEPSPQGRQPGQGQGPVDPGVSPVSPGPGQTGTPGEPGAPRTPGAGTPGEQGPGTQGTPQGSTTQPGQPGQGQPGQGQPGQGPTQPHPPEMMP